MKTHELIGPALDWAVAKCEGYNPFVVDKNAAYYSPDHGSLVYALFSTNWSQGGPIIEREGGFHLKIWLESRPDTKCEAHIHNYDGDWIQFGPTPLIAAMRVYVASKMGVEIEIPEELK